jgi:CheY-like chemotaxis protein
MRILEAQDGHEALDLVANNNPDFVFMDVDMPGISGIETCRHLRARVESEDTPILIVTGATLRDAFNNFESETSPDTAQQLNGLRVLIAEDNPVNQLLVESMLTGLGASYKTVENGLLAVQAVDE